jgi:putative RNA 2'-phosphotransferase
MAGERGERVSKFLAFVLRHRPDSIGLTLDPSGWAGVFELIARAGQAGVDMDEALLKQIVASDGKRRYSLSADGMSVRANYGHSVRIDLGLEATQPPEHLFHGTARSNLEAIRKSGLKPAGRQFVHLSVDGPTAVSVGRRHGTPAVLRIRSLEMHVAGHRFYHSESGIWLTPYVPPGYIVFPD